MRCCDSDTSAFRPATCRNTDTTGVWPRLGVAALDEHQLYRYRLSARRLRPWIQDDRLKGGDHPLHTATAATANDRQPRRPSS